jgi:hypothetical protein
METLKNPKYFLAAMVAAQYEQPESEWCSMFEHPYSPTNLENALEKYRFLSFIQIWGLRETAYTGLFLGDVAQGGVACGPYLLTVADNMRQLTEELKALNMGDDYAIHTITDVKVLRNLIAKYFDQRTMPVVPIAPKPVYITTCEDLP